MSKGLGCCRHDHIHNAVVLRHAAYPLQRLLDDACSFGMKHGTITEDIAATSRRVIRRGAARFRSRR